MFALVTRGGKAFEWYAYGPEYYKGGDSFLGRPELIEKTVRAAQFLGRAEDWLYDARWAGRPEVAFVFPRSSEIWGRAGMPPGGKTDLGTTAFESAKRVYLALAHATFSWEAGGLWGRGTLARRATASCWTRRRLRSWLGLAMASRPSSNAPAARGTSCWPAFGRA